MYIRAYKSFYLFYKVKVYLNILRAYKRCIEFLLLKEELRLYRVSFLQLKNKGNQMREEKIYLVITNPKNGLSKNLDVTDYSIAQFGHTAKVYAVNFDVRVKRYV
jgi:hypothetical protein